MGPVVLNFKWLDCGAGTDIVAAVGVQCFLCCGRLPGRSCNQQNHSLSQYLAQGHVPPDAMAAWLDTSISLIVCLFPIYLYLTITQATYICIIDLLVKLKKKEAIFFNFFCCKHAVGEPAKVVTYKKIRSQKLKISRLCIKASCTILRGAVSRSRSFHAAISF